MSNTNPLSSIHGFFMLGRDSLVLYHSSRFHMPPHAFQMILTASLPEDAMNAYRADMDAHPSGDTVWLVHNEPGNEFALQQLYDGEITSFQTDIKRLVNGDYPSDPYVFRNVQIQIQKTLYFRQFNPNDAYQGGPYHNPYIVFSGNGSEVFLSHYLTKDYDYDLLARMSWLKSDSEPQQVPYAVSSMIRTFRADGPSKPDSCPLEAGLRYVTQDDEDEVPFPSDDLGPHHGSPTHQQATPSILLRSVYWYDPTTING
ncbi:MAG: hypothetical protein HUU21_19110 [Polyangiaceae bacterium]|nr:hypothetical protein [Polyangiaceae bacterium]